MLIHTDPSGAVIPFSDAEAAMPQSLNDVLRLKKKKNPQHEEAGNLLQQWLLLAAPPLEAAIAPAGATAGDATGALAAGALAAGAQRGDGRPQHAVLMMPAGQPLPQPAGRAQPQRMVLPAAIAAAANAEGPAALSAPAVAASATATGMMAAGKRVTPAAQETGVIQPQALSAASQPEAAGALAAAPAASRRLHRPGEEGGALNPAAAVAPGLPALPCGEASPPLTQEADSAPALPLTGLPAEQADSDSGMKLTYQFLRWGSGRVDISSQPTQLLFQPSSDMVRERLGESLLTRAHSPAWQMDEQPDGRQPSPQQQRNDEEESE